MLWNRKRYQILEDWYASLDYSFEAGGTPLFDIGLSHNILDGLLSLAALRDFSAVPQPTLSRPLLSAGGNTPLWLLTLDRHWLELADSEGEDLDESPSEQAYAFDTTFTAVDPATHMASLTVNAGSGWRTLNRSPKVRATGLPTSVRSLIFPQLEPAVISTWQALPLTMSLPKPQLRSLQLAPTQGNVLRPFVTPMDERALDDEQSPRPPMLGNDDKPVIPEDEKWISIVSLLVVFLLLLVSLFG